MCFGMVLLGLMGGPEIIIVVLAVVVLFGSKRIPELMKGLGKGIKEVKKFSSDHEFTKDIKEISSEINEVNNEIKDLTSPVKFIKKKK